MIHIVPSENPHYEGSPASQSRCMFSVELSTSFHPERQLTETAFNDRRGGLFDDLSTNPGTPRFLDDFQNLQGTAHAAEALAELNGMSSDRGSVDGVSSRAPYQSIKTPAIDKAGRDNLIATRR